MEREKLEILRKLQSLFLQEGVIERREVRDLLHETREAAVNELRDLLIEAQRHAFITRIEEITGRKEESEVKKSTDIDTLTSILRGESKPSFAHEKQSAPAFWEREGSTPFEEDDPKAGSSHSNGNHQSLYVFGIIRSNGLEDFLEELSHIHTFEHASPLRLVTSGEMSAVLCEMPSNVMSKDVISQRMHDPEWLEPRVQTHQRVQKRIMQHRTIIPMRFATLFSSEDRLRSFMNSHRQSLTDCFKRIDNTQEWGVKLFATAAAVDTENTSSPTPRGEKFFSEEHPDVDQTESQRGDLASKANYVHSRLSKCAEEALINDPSNKLASGANTIEALNGVYLINTQNLSHFHETLLSIQSDLEPLGYNLQLNGPWPPYHFVRLNTSSSIPPSMS